MYAEQRRSSDNMSARSSDSDMSDASALSRASSASRLSSTSYMSIQSERIGVRRRLVCWGLFCSHRQYFSFFFKLHANQCFFFFFLHVACFYSSAWSVFSFSHTITYKSSHKNTKWGNLKTNLDQSL